VGQASVDPLSAPHIALLLPTGSDVFAKPAEAVRAGRMSRPGVGFVGGLNVGARILVRRRSVAADPAQHGQRACVEHVRRLNVQSFVHGSLSAQR